MSARVEEHPNPSDSEAVNSPSSIVAITAQADTTHTWGWVQGLGFGVQGSSGRVRTLSTLLLNCRLPSWTVQVQAAYVFLVFASFSCNCGRNFSRPSRPSSVRAKHHNHDPTPRSGSLATPAFLM